MTESGEPSPNAYRLAAGLEPIVDAAGAFEVYGHLVFRWWDRIRNLVQPADPLVEVEASSQHEVKLHFGGAASPARSKDAALTLRAFVTALRELPAEAAAGPIYASISFHLPTYHCVMNIPTRAIRLRIDQKRRRILFQLFTARRTDLAAMAGHDNAPRAHIDVSS